MKVINLVQEINEQEPTKKVIVTDPFGNRYNIDN